MANLTVQQYANLRKITPGAVRKSIYYGHNLPGVIGIARFGKAYSLDVTDSFVRDQKKVLKKMQK